MAARLLTLLGLVGLGFAAFVLARRPGQRKAVAAFAFGIIALALELAFWVWFLAVDRDSSAQFGLLAPAVGVFAVVLGFGARSEAHNWMRSAGIVLGVLVLVTFFVSLAVFIAGLPYESGE